MAASSGTILPGNAIYPAKELHMSLSDYAEGKLLDAMFNAASFSVAARYAKLHTGDPGEAGTANAATETTRKAITSAASASGVFTSVNSLDWTSVAATETITHISIWDASTAGNCLGSGALAASKALTAGDNFSIPTGSLTVTLD